MPAQTQELRVRILGVVGDLLVHGAVGARPLLQGHAGPREDGVRLLPLFQGFFC